MIIISNSSHLEYTKMTAKISTQLKLNFTLDT